MARILQTIFPVSVNVRLTAHTSYSTQIAQTIATNDINVPMILCYEVMKMRCSDVVRYYDSSQFF